MAAKLDKAVDAAKRIGDNSRMLVTAHGELCDLVGGLYETLLRRNFHETLVRDLPHGALGPDLLSHCPFHNGPQPALRMSGTRPVWRCYGGCGTGTWLSYLQRRRGLTLFQAIELLAQEARFDLKAAAHYSTWKFELERDEIFEEALRYFRENLFTPEAEAVLDYLRACGYRDDLLRTAEIGAFTTRESLEKHLTAAGYSGEQICAVDGKVQCGAFTFLDQQREPRIVHPFRDEMGRIHTMFARIVRPLKNHEQPTARFRAICDERGVDEMVFQRHLSKGSPRLIVVEGCVDAMLLSALNLDGVVALAQPNKLQVQLSALISDGTEHFMLALDTDDKGRRLTQRAALFLLERGCRVEVVRIPSQFKDPAELIGRMPQGGFALFVEALGSAQPAADWCVEQMCAEGPEKEVDSFAAVRMILSSAAKIENEGERAHLLEELNRFAELPSKELEMQLEQYFNDNKDQLTGRRYREVLHQAWRAIQGGDELALQAALDELARVRSGG